jgi:hypothetical protein
MTTRLTRRDLAKASFAAATAVATSTLGERAWCAADVPATGPTNMSPAAERAWRNYQEALEVTRRFLFTRELSERPQIKAEANTLMMQVQAAAYHMVLAPRVDYPRFYVNTIFEPVVGTWLGPCPDFRYRFGFIDGTQTYRIWGRRSNTRFLDLHLGPWPGAQEYSEYKKLPTTGYPVDQMQLEADGSFEIVASPNPQKGNWIKLDPAQERMFINVREAFYDWAHDRPSLLRIERIGATPPRPLQYDEAQFIKYMEHAARFVKIIIDDFAVAGFDHTWKRTQGQVNTFVYADMADSNGGNHAARYCTMVYEVGPDDALVIELEVPTSKYWGFCLMDRYLTTTDYMYHQSSLNGHQVRRDGDGKVRFVLSEKDPGVPNWLDPVETVPLGYLLFRQYFQTSAVPVPTVKKVRIDEVRKHLPADTPHVSPTMRTQQINERSWALLALYGY